MAKIKVLIIDDSALIRSVMSEIVNSQADMEVVGVAPDPIVAREMIKQLNPDVLTLDVEMPRMNGLDFLEKLMRLRPTPVVMLSTLTEQGSDVALRALELGAVDYIAKPRLGVKEGLGELVDDVADKIRNAARARVRHLPGGAQTSAPAPIRVTGKFMHGTERVVFIGSSTGGTEALKAVLTRMPADSPAIMITQHMPESFTASFAARLNGLSAMQVREAGHNERVLPGHAYIAPGHSHLLICKSGADYYTALSQADPVSRHRPSVDVLFDSAARILGANGLGVILTGMGKDGAAGMLRMRQAGAYTIAQDAATCVVYGMPKAAVELGAVHEVLPLAGIAGRIVDQLSQRA
ncbi:MAG: chemotaxis response regulator protein-glutamate methylesterase [Hydrogenophilales bacterium]|nr:chemotaxis response regulator protein-glutamate methylesterase [Hydrogenophilales bacterium]